MTSGPYTFESRPRLVPVVELEPTAYATQEHPHGSGSWREDPHGWDRYWRRSLADAGISGLDPFPPGSWSVPVELLVEAHVLGALLRAHADALPDENHPRWAADWRDSLGSFDGGFVLCDGDLPLMSPNCCCCLGSLLDWKAAAALTSPGWGDLWIGHPQASIRRQADLLEIRQNGHDWPPAGPERVVVPLPALRRAIETAERDLQAFAARLVPTCREWLSRGRLDPGDAGLLARRLAGVDGAGC